VGPELIQEFERREGVKVVIDTFSSNEELLAKLQSGATGYDVAVPSDFMVAIMIQQGLLSELDQQALPNASFLEPHLQALPSIRSGGTRSRICGAAWGSGTILR
jgi:spermidine/putrescine transport system substrate-binding protein